MSKGILFGVLSALFASIYAIINRHVFVNYDVNVFHYVVTFITVNGLLGAAATMLYSDKKKFRLPDFKHVVFVSVIGTAALALLTFAQSETTASNAAVLTSLIIPSTALWSVVILHERIPRRSYVWMLALITAVYLIIIGFRSFALNTGDVIVLTAVVLFGVNNAYVKRLIPQFGGEFIINFRLAASGIVFIIVAGLMEGDLSFVVTQAGLWPVLAGVFSYATRLFTFKAMNTISATNALTLNSLYVVFTVAGAALFLDEALTVVKLIGCIGAVYFIRKIVTAKP